MKPIVIIAAVPQEAILLEHALGKTRRKKGIAYDYVEGELGKQRVIICAGGVGKINAAVTTTAMIEQFKPKLVINTGCAGAFPGNGLTIGDLAVASEEVLGDEGVLTSTGWQDLQFMNLPAWIHRSRRYYNNIPLSKLAAEKAMQMADHYGVKLVRGRFVTISTCTGSKERAEVMASQFGAICESMEGGAVALTCLRYSINCLEIRGISNIVEERDIRGWDIPGAVEAAQRFVLKFLEETERRKPQKLTKAVIG